MENNQLKPTKPETKSEPPWCALCDRNHEWGTPCDQQLLDTLRKQISLMRKQLSKPACFAILVMAFATTILCDAGNQVVLFNGQWPVSDPCNVPLPLGCSNIVIPEGAAKTGMTITCSTLPLTSTGQTRKAESNGR